MLWLCFRSLHRSFLLAIALLFSVLLYDAVLFSISNCSTCNMQILYFVYLVFCYIIIDMQSTTYVFDQIPATRKANVKLLIFAAGRFLTHLKWRLHTQMERLSGKRGECVLLKSISHYLLKPFQISLLITAMGVSERIALQRGYGLEDAEQWGRTPEETNSTQAGSRFYLI